ncbi:MAG: hypothetical protein HC903_15985 [Methylacidiphilales bacterium]|nr:hypothetical protein [Candidatus Methylacidiphilales bacterium]
MPDFSAITNYLAYLESGTNRKLRTEYDNFDPHLPRVLAKIAPFDKLDSTVLDGIVNKLEPLRYRMGQAILVKENLPARIAILYDGQARLLGYPPGAIAPQTLENSNQVQSLVQLVLFEVYHVKQLLHPPKQSVLPSKLLIFKNY